MDVTDHWLFKNTKGQFGQLNERTERLGIV